MALTTDDIKKRYPLPVYNYRVAVYASFLAASQSVIPESALSLISCTEISGLKMELETVVYRHGLSFMTGFNIIPSTSKEVRLTIRKGVTTDGKFLSDWMRLSYPLLQPAPVGRLRKRDLLIDLCDEAGLPVVRWKVLKAMPVKLDAPAFKVETSEVAFEQLDLVAHEVRVDYDLT